ncbi:MAG: hypothetical protein JOZ57_17310, partial [Abitibacteriaceae bacterium]|nr:hypothetical protein [Abditibacteriaceae bacterium]
MSDEPAKRVLFLGVTGAGKNQAMETLAQRLAAHGGSKWTTVVFEDSYLWNGDDPENEKQTFLDGSLQAQYLKWTTAWSDFEKYLDNNPEEHIFLSVHGCFVRGHYGVRSPLDPSRIARSFKPDLVVTFIADVYDMWWMTEGRAKGESVKGRPTLEQLIFARRHELIVGDQIALTGSVSRRQVRNLMLAVGHPTETLSHCIINPYTCKVAYLSFPISQPRDWEHRGDPEPRHMVSRFIKDATEKSYDNPKLMILCPLGIDEIPFTKILPDPEKDAKGEVLDRDLIFDRDKERWALEEFWPSTKRLALPTPIVGPSLP